MTKPETDAGSPGVPVVTPETVGRSPSWLLTASNRVVPFTDRETEMADLRRWLGGEEGQASVACRLVHGAQGQGKTRLAVELAHAATGSGWHVTFARHRDSAGAIAGGGGRVAPGSDGTLIVVDDAGTWPIAVLLGLVGDLLGRNSSSLRFLLFADRDSDWQTSLCWRLNLVSANADAMELAQLGQTQEGRVSQFTVALDRFAGILGGEVRTAPLAERLADDAFRSVQMLHMAALADVLATKRGEPAVDDPYRLSSFLLEQEEGGWQATKPSSDGTDPLPATLARVAFVANLIGPVGAETAKAALQEAGIASTAENATLLVGRHAVLYPPTDTGYHLQPMEPARLREDMIGLFSEESPGGASAAWLPGPDWARQAVIRLLGIRPGQTVCAPFAAQAMMRLAQSFRWPHVTQRLLYPPLDQWPQLVVEAGSGVAIAMIVALPDAPQVTLNQISGKLPANGGPDVALGAFALSRRRLRRFGGVGDADEKAESRYSLSFLAEAACLHETALSAVTEALALWQPSADGEDESSEEDYVSRSRRFKHVQAANRRSLLLEMLGRHEEALSALEDCVPVWERLLRYQYKQPGLGWSRTKRPSSPGSLLMDHPVTIAEEAVSVGRRLAAADPDAFAAEFGEWLIILLNRYVGAKQYADATRIAPEVEELLRDAGSADSPQFTRQAVAAFFVLGQLWMVTGEYTKAVDSYSRAAVILRGVPADSDWGGREPALIKTLAEGSFARLLLGDYAAGLAEAEEALPLCRQADRENPAKYSDLLVRTLSTMALHYAMLERADEALAAAEEAHAASRSLAGIEWFGLSLALESYGWAMSKAGRHAEALKTTAESLALWRKAWERAGSTEAQRGLPDLLLKYALVRVAAGTELQEALSAVNEAVEYCQTSGTDAGARKLSACLEMATVVREALGVADPAVSDQGASPTSSDNERTSPIARPNDPA